MKISKFNDLYVDSHKKCEDGRGVTARKSIISYNLNSPLPRAPRWWRGASRGPGPGTGTAPRAVDPAWRWSAWRRRTGPAGRAQ